MSELKIGRITLGICSTNCYFVYRADSQEIIVIDPADKGQYLFDKLSERGFTIKGILLTHAHFDHIWGCNELRELSGAPVYAYEEERVLCENAKVNVSAQVQRPYTVNPDHYIKDNEEIHIAGMTCRLLATPGHTVGSCCYYFEEGGLLLSGDTLFCESVGRTDLPTGSMGALVNSIKTKLFVLPEDTKVYPGHGEPTTLAHEKQYNPFC